MKSALLVSAVVSALLGLVAAFPSLVADRAPSVRWKLAHVKKYDHPQVVILGSSRAAFGIVPSVLEKAWRLPSGSVVNAAFPGMTPLEIEEGWMAYADKFRSAKLVIYCTDDYFFSIPPSYRPESIAASFAPLRMAGNLLSNLTDTSDTSQSDAYFYGEDGLLRHPMVGINRMGMDKAKTIKSTAAAWTGWKYDPTIELRMAALGRQIKANGSRLVFVHLPIHSEERRALDGAQFKRYVNSMERVSEELDSKFYLLDAPKTLGLTDASFKADPIHLQPKEAEIQTAGLAEILKRGLR